MNKPSLPHGKARLLFAVLSIGIVAVLPAEAAVGVRSRVRAGAEAEGVEGVSS